MAAASWRHVLDDNYISVGWTRASLLFVFAIKKTFQFQWKFGPFHLANDMTHRLADKFISLSMLNGLIGASK